VELKNNKLGIITIREKRKCKRWTLDDISDADVEGPSVLTVNTGQQRPEFKLSEKMYHSVLWTMVEQTERNVLNWEIQKYLDTRVS
jgi:hypothetical protein